MRNAVALVFACLALVTPSAVPAQTLEDVVRDLEAAYSRVTDLRAEFTQTAFNKSLNQTIPAQGTVYLKKGAGFAGSTRSRRPKRSSPTAGSSGSTRRR